MKCPRRADPFAYNPPHEDEWKMRDGIRACSYCGSMHPDDFLDALRLGRMLVGTDKNYKVYVDIPHPMAGKKVIVGTESGPAYDQNGEPTKSDLTLGEKLKGRYERNLMGTAPEMRSVKFYFQHLDSDGQDSFLKLYNDHMINLEPHFGLYRTPFFARKEPK